VIGQLLGTAIDTSASVAHVLARLERATDRGSRGADASLRSVFEKQWPKESRISADRASRVILRAWHEQVRPRAAHRPDVLALTCDLLANPDVPWSRDVGRFVVTLGLRALYGVEYSTDSLSDLRVAYGALQNRFKRTRRRRIRKHSGLESLIIDLACMEGSTSRSATGKNLDLFYSDFRRYPFGIADAMRRFAPKQEWPELHGDLPDFATITKLAFAQPTCIAGLDDIVQGLLASVPEAQVGVSNGGLVSLVAGPPGSGKTSFCLTLASRMSELGSTVSYLATEEAPSALRAKLVANVDPTFLEQTLLAPPDFIPGKSDIEFVDGRDFGTFESLVTTIESEVQVARAQVRDSIRQPGLYLVFPRVLVVDSLTALAHTRATHTSQGERRRDLARLLLRLRELGICVFLVGGPNDSSDEGLAYLVDNVFSLEVEERLDVSHRVRVFNVQKTRLQASYRGRHVLHLSRVEGVTINPSLHSTARALHALGWKAPDEEVHAQFRISDGNDGRHDYLNIRGSAHVLVYGYGSSGKARLALALAHASRRGTENARTSPSPKLASLDALSDDARTLIVSFLYGAEYYTAIADELYAARGKKRPGDNVSIIDLYPGFLDPETLVARIASALSRARLEGRRFTAVVVDGIHNMMMQFPLLQREPLLWPTLYRLLRAEGVDTISTYTFFRVPALSSTARPEAIDLVTDSQVLFSQLLVSNCDYSLIVERNLDKGARPSWIEVRVVGSLEPLPRRAEQFTWDTRSFEPVSSRRPPR
jgi:KaiC/GvpD/RAD55 family RecA-like ATPase